MPIEGFSFLFLLDFVINLRKYSWKMFYFISDLDSIEINEKESWILHDFPMVCPPHDNFLTLTWRDYCPYRKYCMSLSCVVIVKMIILKLTPCTRSILKLTIVSLPVRKFWIEPAHHVRCSGPWVLHSRSELPLSLLSAAYATHLQCGQTMWNQPLPTGYSFDQISQRLLWWNKENWSSPRRPLTL